MGTRVATILVLLAAAAPAEPAPEGLVRRLGDPDPLRRRIATTRLLEMGPKAWPALEAATHAPDPEVSGNARRILRAWAWVPPHLRAALNPVRRRALFGLDPVARLQAVTELRDASGDAGREALEYLFAAPPAAFRIEETSPKRTYLELAPEVAFRVWNASRHPGWSPARLGVAELVQWRPFGRPVSFPTLEARGGPLARRRFLSKGRITVEQTTFIEETEWVPPGAAARAPRHVSLVAQRPGVATYSIGEVSEAYFAGQAVAHAEGGRLVAIRNPLPFDLPVNLAARAFTYYLLPREATWGATTDGARVAARREGDRLVVRISSDFVAHAPRDFGSAWYVVLDDRDEVIAHGPLDGGGDEARSYAREDLEFVPRPPDALERAFPLPKPAPAAVRLLVGVAFSRGRRPAGYTAVSSAVELR